jgi:hypothetical protein
VGYGPYLGPRAAGAQKVGSGCVLYAVQRESKSASEAAENSGQSPRNLLCTGKIRSQLFGTGLTNSSHNPQSGHLPSLNPLAISAPLAF